MSPPSRISIIETVHELLITNPPRRSAIRVGFLLLSIAIVAVTTKMGLFDKSPVTVASGLFGLMSFLAIAGFLAYFLGKEFIWLVSGGETLRIAKDTIVREIRGSPFRDRAFLTYNGQLTAEVLEHTYPTDDTGLKEVVRLATASGPISFGRELDRSEAEAVAEAVRRFAARRTLGRS